MLHVLNWLSQGQMREKTNRFQTAAYIFSRTEQKLFTSISRNFHWVEHSKLSGSRTSAWSHRDGTWNWTILDKLWIVVVCKGNATKESINEWSTLNISDLTYCFLFCLFLYPARVLLSHINPSEFRWERKVLGRNQKCDSQIFWRY